MRVDSIPAALERAAASGGRGVTLVGTREGERRIGYDELLAVARRAAGGLSRAGIRTGDRVLLVLPAGAEFLVSFFGAMILGAIPCPVSPPQGFGSRETFVRRLGQFAASVGARAAAVEPDLAGAAREGLPPGVTILSPASLPGGDPAPPAAIDPEATAFVQFTSGTTEIPKGVRLSHRALLANLAQIACASGFREGDAIVSWLPLFHDMGLIGGVLSAVHFPLDLVLGTPYGFLRRPRTWLEAISRFRGTHSPAPNFAYRYVAERLAPGDVADLDLSSWRVAYAGAEMVHAAGLAAFEALLAPRGLSPATLRPCYGMAEACLAVTLSGAGTRFRTLAVSRRGIAEEGRAIAPEAASDEWAIVSCGRPVSGTEVRVVEGDADQPAGRLGEVLVRGPTRLSGDWGEDGPGLEAGWFRTGDLGFTDGGELFVTGRRRDLIILRGENHHPAEIEWVAESVPGVREGRVAAFGLPDAGSGTETLCLLVEVDRRAAMTSDQIETAIRRQVQDETGLAVARIALVGPGTVPLTTSGKIQRGEARRIFLEVTTLDQ